MKLELKQKGQEAFATVLMNATELSRRGKNLLSLSHTFKDNAHEESC